MNTTLLKNPIGDPIEFVPEPQPVSWWWVLILGAVLFFTLAVLGVITKGTFRLSTMSPCTKRCAMLFEEVREPFTACRYQGNAITVESPPGLSRHATRELAWEAMDRVPQALGIARVVSSTSGGWIVITRVHYVHGPETIEVLLRPHSSVVIPLCPAGTTPATELEGACKMTGVLTTVRRTSRYATLNQAWQAAMSDSVAKGITADGSGGFVVLDRVEFASGTGPITTAYIKRQNSIECSR